MEEEENSAVEEEQEEKAGFIVEIVKKEKPTLTDEAPEMKTHTMKIGNLTD